MEKGGQIVGAGGAGGGWESIFENDQSDKVLNKDAESWGPVVLASLIQVHLLVTSAFIATTDVKGHVPCFGVAGLGCRVQSDHILVTVKMSSSPAARHQQERTQQNRSLYNIKIEPFFRLHSMRCPASGRISCRSFGSTPTRSPGPSGLRPTRRSRRARPSRCLAQSRAADWAWFKEVMCCCGYLWLMKRPVAKKAPLSTAESPDSVAVLTLHRPLVKYHTKPSETPKQH